MIIDELIPRFTLGALELTKEPFLVEFGQDWGVGLNDVRTIDTGLLDGEFLRTVRTGNRIFTVTVLIEAEDLGQLAYAESALMEECNRDWNTFTVDPGDGFGEVTVFRTYRAQVRFARDDDYEREGLRRYVLNIAAGPFGFGAAPIVTVASAAAPITPNTVSISDGTSATGWSSPAGALAQPVVSSGKLRIAPRDAGVEGRYTSETTKTLSATDFSATEYVQAEIKAETGMRLWPIPEGSAGITYVQPPSKDGGLTAPEQYVSTRSQYGNPAAWAGAFVGSSKLQLVTFQTLADGAVRYTWRCQETAGTDLRFVAGTGQDVASPPTNKGFLLDNVQRSNVNPVVTPSGRASLLSLVVEGSARTAPSIAVESETDSLGEVIFYTSSALGSAGYGGPSLKPFLVGGSVTADTDAVSGSYSVLTDGGGPVVWSAPANQLPEGSYVVVARVRSGGGTLEKVATLTVSQIEGVTEYGQKVLPSTVTAVPDTPSGDEGEWTNLAVLGVVTLPRQKAPPESSAAVQFELTSTGIGDGNTLHVDDLWVFHHGEGSDYTRVDCGSGAVALGTGHSRMWMDIATQIRPDPGLYVGTLSDRADAFDPGHPKVVRRGVHPLVAGVNRCYVITTGARNPTITYTYDSAWHSHAARPLPQ